MKYSFTSRIRYSEIGEDGNLTLPGLINYFQDCSTFQSEAIGEGVAELKKRGCAWVSSTYIKWIGKRLLLLLSEYSQ